MRIKALGSKESHSKRADTDVGRVTLCSGSTSESADGAEVVLGGGRVEACDAGGGGAIALVLGWADMVAVRSPSILLLCEDSVSGAGAVALVLVCVVADNVVRRLV